ncbi:hypothetical protein FB451DRAFT_1529009 [Mycena latifolia]|nr:hypothetical protein FB451DRAFT_1529009 [Mycena latifolia]
MYPPASLHLHLPSPFPALSVVPVMRRFILGHTPLLLHILGRCSICICTFPAPPPPPCVARLPPLTPPSLLPHPHPHAPYSFAPSLADPRPVPIVAEAEAARVWAALAIEADASCLRRHAMDVDLPEHEHEHEHAQEEEYTPLYHDLARAAREGGSRQRTPHAPTPSAPARPALTHRISTPTPPCAPSPPRRSRPRKRPACPALLPPRRVCVEDSPAPLAPPAPRKRLGRGAPRPLPAALLPQRRGACASSTHRRLARPTCDACTRTYRRLGHGAPCPLPAAPFTPPQAPRVPAAPRYSLRGACARKVVPAPRLRRLHALGRGAPRVPAAVRYSLRGAVRIEDSPWKVAPRPTCDACMRLGHRTPRYSLGRAARRVRVRVRPPAPPARGVSGAERRGGMSPVELRLGRVREDGDGSTSARAGAGGEGLGAGGGAPATYILLENLRQTVEGPKKRDSVRARRVGNVWMGKRGRERGMRGGWRFYAAAEEEVQEKGKGKEKEKEKATAEPDEMSVDENGPEHEMSFDPAPARRSRKPIAEPEAEADDEPPTLPAASSPGRRGTAEPESDAAPATEPAAPPKRRGRTPTAAVAPASARRGGRSCARVEDEEADPLDTFGDADAELVAVEEEAEPVLEAPVPAHAGRAKKPATPAVPAAPKARAMRKGAARAAVEVGAKENTPGEEREEVEGPAVKVRVSSRKVKEEVVEPQANTTVPRRATRT